MTTYPIFASGLDDHSGIFETLTGTIDVTSWGGIINPHLRVTGYPQEFNGIAFGGFGLGYSTFAYDTPNLGMTPLWSLSVVGAGNNGFGADLTMGLGTRGPVPTLGADIFWFSACCGPVVSVTAAYNNPAIPPLGHIAGLPLPLAIPAPDMAIGLPGLMLVACALIWLAQRRRVREFKERSCTPNTS